MILESEFIKINEEGGDEDEEEVRNKDVTGTGEEANGVSNLDQKHGENESEKATASAASKPHDDDNATPKDQARAQSTLSPDPPKKTTLHHHTRNSIYIGEYSTLVGARKVYLALARNTDPSFNKKIGILNFASALQPGGGFINGSHGQVRFLKLHYDINNQLNVPVNQEESLVRTSTLYPSLITEAASQFYAHHEEDPDNAYYTHAMVYSPAVVFFRDDDGEWRSPVEVDVLTSAAVNAGDIRRGLEKEERLRLERLEMEYWKRKAEESERLQMEYWKRKGEENRKRIEKAMAERQKLRDEAMKRKAKEEIPTLEKEQAKNQAKLKKGIINEKETDKGKTKDSGGEREEPIDEQEKVVAEVEEIAKLKNLVKGMGKRKETDVGKAKESVSEKEEPFVEQIEDEKEEVEEKLEENQENTSDNPALGCSSDSQQNGTEENTELVAPSEVNQEPLKDAEIQVPLKVTEEPTSSIVVAHPLSPPTQPLQAPVPDPKLPFFLALKNAEIQIQQTMYDRSHFPNPPPLPATPNSSSCPRILRHR